MQTSYLFLKPEIMTLEDQKRQEEDIKQFIRPAIGSAQLSSVDDRVNGVVVFDITDDLIQKIYKADILIIDANCYEVEGMHQFSPYLYYCMAIGHSLGNATILLTNTTRHLSRNLLKCHTLDYSSVNVWEFITDFATIVQEIRQQQNYQPDNPIQEYLYQDTLAKARLQIAEVEASKARQKLDKQPIIIHRVG